MHISQIRESRFLKKEDVGRQGLIVTIAKLTQENVAKQNEPEELEFALHFEEIDKPLILKATNANLIGAILGSEETDEWRGKQICLYEDPTIMFAGKMVGGIRARDVNASPNAQRFEPVQQTQPVRRPFGSPQSAQQRQQPTQQPQQPQQQTRQQLTSQTWPSGQPVPDDDNIPI